MPSKVWDEVTNPFLNFNDTPGVLMLLQPKSRVSYGFAVFLSF